MIRLSQYYLYALVGFVIVYNGLSTSNYFTVYVGGVGHLFNFYDRGINALSFIFVKLCITVCWQLLVTHF